MRYAIYFSPPEHDALTQAAAAWLGRSAFTGQVFTPRPVGQLSAAEVAFHTAAARRYGFHATLMAPFELAADKAEHDLAGALADFCKTAQPVRVPDIVLAQLDGFFALVPGVRNDALDRLAGEVVTAFDRFRAPLSEAEKARRGASHLSPPHLRNLLRWGYPYVFDEFRFHMTLSGRVDEADAPFVRGAIETHFGALLNEPLNIGSLALFMEPEPGAPFIVRSFHDFEPLSERKTA